MQVTQANAAIVAQLFDRLSDARFQMRTPAAILKGSTIEEAAMLEVAGQVGCPFRHRIADGALLIERPCSVEDAVATAANAKLIAEGNGEAIEPMEVQFNAQPSVEQPRIELAPESEPSIGEDDEDAQFHGTRH